MTLFLIGIVITLFFGFSVRKLNRELPFKNIFRTETKDAILWVDRHTSKIVAQIKRSKAFRFFAFFALFGALLTLISLALIIIVILLYIINITDGIALTLVKISRFTFSPVPLFIVINLVLFDLWALNHNILITPTKSLKLSIVGANFYFLILGLLVVSYCLGYH